MKNIDYIVVGDGYAALFFAHQLIKNNKTFVLFSEGKKSASQVSAGIINPVVLKRFTTFWLALEQIDFLKQTLSEIEEYTHENYMINENIHRIFHDEIEKNLWLKKAEREDLIPFLSKDFITLNSFKNPNGCGRVMQSSRLDVQEFFSGMLKFLSENGNLVSERFNYDTINLEENIYGDYQFKNIVFAEGIGVRDNPYFSEIPILPNKGHHIKVKLAEIPNEKFTVKKKHFLFPLNGGIHFYGGTYDRERFDSEIDGSAIEQLENSLSDFYPNNFEVVEKQFGFRPTVKDRRPIIGNHPEFKNLFVFNGLGARGILNGCYFSKSLFEFCEFRIPLLPEVDLKRFCE